jgi:hypothetical protein
MNKTINRLIKAKQAGYVYCASVVKSIHNTVYYNVNLIDDCIECGKWIPCLMGQYGKWHGRIGTSKLPEKTCFKSTLYTFD